MAASLARGAAALAGGNGSNGATRTGGRRRRGAGDLVAAGATTTVGRRLGRSCAADRRHRPRDPMRESLGDEPVVSGGGTGASAGGPKPGFTPSGARIGRNDPCWCGSGAKYKKCHGR